jgi:hypothetical protein
LLRQLDLVGGFLFLGASILIVTALQEAGSTYIWNSAVIITLIIFSVLLLAAFIVWERWVTYKSIQIVPLITWQFVRRQPLAMFMYVFAVMSSCVVNSHSSSLLIGIPFTTTLVQVPQRLQIINNLSPLQAGTRLLPYIVFLPVGTICASIISKLMPGKPVPGMLVGAFLQLAAAICFVTVQSSTLGQVDSAQYAFQALMGLGNGISYTVNFNGMPFVLGGRKELVPRAMGANTQFRYLGGALGLGVVTAAFNTYVHLHLSRILSVDTITSILESSSGVYDLSPNVQAAVIQDFADAFTLQWEIICIFVGLQIVANLLAI